MRKLISNNRYIGENMKNKFRSVFADALASKIKSVNAAVRQAMEHPKVPKEKRDRISKALCAIWDGGTTYTAMMKVIGEVLDDPTMGDSQSRFTVLSALVSPAEFKFIAITETGYMSTSGDKVDTTPSQRAECRLLDDEEVDQMIALLSDPQWATITSSEVFRPILLSLLDTEIPTYSHSNGN